MLSEYNYHTEIMGCSFDMTFVSDSSEIADNYFIQAMKIAQSYEKKFSRFDDRSELSQINERRTSKISKEFANIYNLAYILYKKTNTKFNPLVQVANIGYDKSFKKISKKISANINKIRYDINMDMVRISQDKIILQDTQKLDFGGFLKGYVVQKIAKDIKSKNGIIINIGGDLYAKGVGEDGQPFSVEIINPHSKKQNIIMTLSDEALCTSGTYRRTWKYKNNKKHHILKAESRDSVQTDIISASIIHRDGATADAYATTAVILGAKKAQKFLLSKNIKFVIICENSDILKSY